jgi:hypothetical protein
LQAEVDAAIKKLSELKLVLADHQKVRCLGGWTGAPPPVANRQAVDCGESSCALLCAADGHTRTTTCNTQAFEKATGKSSSSNREAFRAALVCRVV